MVVKYSKIHNCTPSPAKMGRHSKLTLEILSLIEKKTILNRRWSGIEIAHQTTDEISTTFSRQTINTGRHLLNFRYKSPKIIQILTEKQKKQRLEFAFSVLNSEEDLTQIVFSDESRDFGVWCY
jgi:hypothetical protein